MGMSCSFVWIKPNWPCLADVYCYCISLQLIALFEMDALSDIHLIRSKLHFF